MNQEPPVYHEVYMDTMILFPQVENFITWVSSWKSSSLRPLVWAWNPCFIPNWIVLKKQNWVPSNEIRYHFTMFEGYGSDKIWFIEEEYKEQQKCNLKTSRSLHNDPELLWQVQTSNSKLPLFESSRSMHFCPTCSSIICTHSIFNVTHTLGQFLAKFLCSNLTLIHT